MRLHAWPRGLRVSLALGLAIGLALPVVSCSVVYDGDVFVTTDAAPPVDAAPPIDVNAGALMLTELEPSEVLEGAGAGGGIPIVIHGSNIAPDAVVSLSGAGFDGEVMDISISGNGELVAFAITIPVLETLADGVSEEMTVAVRQGDGVEASLPLRVGGLDELVASEDAPDGTMSTGDLRPRYARIDIDAPLTFTGTDPARLVATAEAVVAAAVTVDGQDADGNQTGAPGPGGCGGGNPKQDAPCGPGSGGRGLDAGGGGGGGHRLPGNGGTGAGGEAGASSGNAALVPLADAEAGTRGKGGGGGDGAGLLDDSTGGAGGGGGGVIEITSQGTLRVTEGASLSANGGQGGDGGSSCALGGSGGGGGGGGSGGAILLRAARALVDEGTTARVSVAGGGGGAGGSGCASAGGSGGDGRVRVDFPGTSDLPPLVGTGVGAYRGPVLAPDTRAVVEEPALPVSLLGAPNATYHVERLGAARQQVNTLGTGAAEAQVMLEPGLNRVCAVIDDVVAINLSEGANCLDVAYIPR